MTEIDAMNQGISLTPTPEPVSMPEPEPVPIPAPEPEPVSTSEPVPDPTPPPVLEPSPQEGSVADPVQVISVDELLERLQGEIGEPQETEEPQPSEEVPVDPGDVPALEIGPDTLATLDGLGDIQQGLVQISDQLTEIRDHQLRSVLTTPFEDYTVAEGLLLLLLLAAFAAVCAKILRGGLSWLKS